MKRVLQYIFCPLSILAISFALVQNTNAADVHLLVSPTNVFLDLEPGGELEKEFQLENASADATSYKIYASPYSMNNETGEANFDEDTKYSDLKNWITFYDGENYKTTLTGTLEANKTISVKYKINVPDNPPAVGQYASIFVETVDQNSSTAVASIKANVRIGLNLIAKTNVEKKLEAEITLNDMPNFLLGGNITSNFGVKNSSNVHVDVVQEFKVENLFGGLVYEDEVAKIVMPEKTLLIETNWKDSPSVGIYRVSSTVTVPALDLTSTKTSVVVAISPIVLSILVILVVAIIVIIIILIIKKHKIHKLRKAVSWTKIPHCN